MIHVKLKLRDRFKRFFNLSLTDPKAWDPSLWRIRGAVSESGEDVTEETALTYSAYWNAIHLISGTIATLPLNLMRRQGNSSNVVDDPLHRVMHDQWNPWMTAKTGRQVIAAHVLGWGNGYAEKEINAMGEVRALWPIPPNRVIQIHLIDNDLVYEVRADSDTIYIPRRRMLHLHGLGFDGFTGYSVANMARRSLGLGMAMETFGSRFFGAGTNPSGVIKHPGKIKDIKPMREALTDVYAGLGNTHRLMLLEEGMEFQQIALKPEDSQLLESRSFTVSEIARWFNLPPHKLKDLSKSSFNNIEQEQISFVTDSILPWLIDFEQEYNRQLLTDGQRMREKLYFKHIVEGLLRADAKSRAEYYQIMRRNGFMTINEVRGKEDLNPHENPLADELWTEINLAPLNGYVPPTEKDQPEEDEVPDDDELNNVVEVKIKQRGQ